MKKSSADVGKNTKEPFVIMAKPVGSRCNMKCRYCYYLDKGRFSSHEKQARMSYSLLERLIKETVEASSGPVVSFVWHGGEPTIAGIDFYQKVVELERKYLPEGWAVWNNLQTNGLLINDAWARFLKENRFDVGLSLDGAKWVHDKNRTDAGGKPTFNRICRNVDKLRKAGVHVDFLCTVSADSAEDPKGVYEGLKNLGAEWVQFIPIVVRKEDGTFTKESVTPEKYGDFLIAVFDEWVCKDLGKLDVQLFAEMAMVWAGGEASLCWLAPTCGRALIAEEDGAIYSCDHFVDNDHRLGILGDASGKTLGDMLESKEQRAFGTGKRDSLTKECRNCKYLSCCNGGCPKDRFGQSSEGEKGQYYLCAGLKKFFAHADPILHRIMELSAKGTSPDLIMKKLAEADTSGKIT